MDRELQALLEAKRQRIIALRPLADRVLSALESFYDVELTYTSNAIEGNTLSHQETALVIEKGITIGGKTLGEHLEAQDLFAAVRWMATLVSAQLSDAPAPVLDFLGRTLVRTFDAYIAVIEEADQSAP